jgi:hypothetical protein
MSGHRHRRPLKHNSRLNNGSVLKRLCLYLSMSATFALPLSARAQVPLQLLQVAAQETPPAPPSDADEAARGIASYLGALEARVQLLSPDPEVRRRAAAFPAAPVVSSDAARFVQGVVNVDTSARYNLDQQRLVALRNAVEVYAGTLQQDEQTLWRQRLTSEPSLALSHALEHQFSSRQSEHGDAFILVVIAMSQETDHDSWVQSLRQGRESSSTTGARLAQSTLHEFSELRLARDALLQAASTVAEVSSLLRLDPVAGSSSVRAMESIENASDLRLRASAATGQALASARAIADIQRNIAGVRSITRQIQVAFASHSLDRFLSSDAVESSLRSQIQDALSREAVRRFASVDLARLDFAREAHSAMSRGDWVMGLNSAMRVAGVSDSRRSDINRAATMAFACSTGNWMAAASSLLGGPVGGGGDNIGPQLADISRQIHRMRNEIVDGIRRSTVRIESAISQSHASLYSQMQGVREQIESLRRLTISATDSTSAESGLSMSIDQGLTLSRTLSCSTFTGSELATARTIDLEAIDVCKSYSEIRAHLTSTNGRNEMNSAIEGLDSMFRARPDEIHLRFVSIDERSTGSRSLATARSILRRLHGTGAGADDRIVHEVLGWEARSVLPTRVSVGAGLLIPSRVIDAARVALVVEGLHQLQGSDGSVYTAAELPAAEVPSARRQRSRDWLEGMLRVVRTALFQQRLLAGYGLLNPAQSRIPAVFGARSPTSDSQSEWAGLIYTNALFRANALAQLFRSWRSNAQYRSAWDAGGSLAVVTRGRGISWSSDGRSVVGWRPEEGGETRWMVAQYGAPTPDMIEHSVIAETPETPYLEELERRLVLRLAEIDVALDLRMRSARDAATHL